MWFWNNTSVTFDNPAWTFDGGYYEQYTSAAQAIATLTNAGFIVSQPISYAFSATIPRGYVISQNPPAGGSYPPSTPVFLTISLGPASSVPNVMVPNVVGLTWQASGHDSGAYGTLLSNGLTTPGTPSYAASSTVPSGTVISQGIAAGTSVAPGTSVSLVVSYGATPSWYSGSGIVIPAV